VVGDRLADIECGKQAGSRTVLVIGKTRYDNEFEEARQKTDFVADNLSRVAEWILVQEKGDE
jgi:phosphoglycolate phosphatase-like HAD superfamily hydrolase